MRRLTRNCFLVFFLATVGISSAQNVSYGAMAGANAFDSGNTGGQYNVMAKHLTFVLGGYLEYQFGKKWGLKNELQYSHRSFTLLHIGQELSDATLNCVDIAPLIKFDPGTYRDDFYMLAGPKIMLALANSDDDYLKDSFNSVSVGAQFGFGQRFSKVYELEFKLDYGITPFFQLEGLSRPYHGNMFGAFLTFNVDLERLINKNN